MTMYDVDATELIEAVAKELQKEESITPPAWAVFVKTGVHKERPPARQDWWYVRAASILRKVRLKGPIGVSKLRTIYGGKKSRGHKSEIFKRGSGNIIRKLLQQLEKSELLKKEKKGTHNGRVITPKGIKLLDNVSKKIAGSKPVEKVEQPKAEKPKQEEKKLEQPKEQAKEEKPKPTEEKTEKIVEKTKEFAQGKTPAAEKLIEEAKKEHPKKNENKQAEKLFDSKNQKGLGNSKNFQSVPTAAELAAKKQEKNE